MKKTSAKKLSKMLNISPARGLQAVCKAKLITSILNEMAKSKITHAELAHKSQLPRSAVTGILSGSLQKVTIDRLLRLVEALDLSAEIVIKKAA
ncbi:helix-turn-helix domain-containing protein [bacterium]|nr:helix-turn-helix domain-containing protein [bacterium]